MNIGEIFNEGFAVMLVGMGTVFTFLCILIVSMLSMSKIVRRLNEIFPEVVAEVKTTTKKVASNVDEAIAVAIAAIFSKANK